MSLVINTYKKNLLKRFDKDGAIPFLSYQDFSGLEYQEDCFINSLNAEIHYFTYHYQEYKKDEVIIFCHGIGPGHTAYLREIETLCSKGYKVIALDYMGCDKSKGEGLYSINEPTRDVLELLEHLKLKEKIILVGHSLGGYTALNVINKREDIYQAVILSGFIDLKYEAKTLAKLNLLAKEIMNYEKKINPIYYGIDNISYLKNTSDKLLFIQSKDDFLVDYKTALKKVENIHNPNITCVSLLGKKHNPNYTKEAVDLMTNTINRYNALIADKTLDTLEKRQEYFKDITAFDMTTQDENVWSIIFDFLNDK